LKSNIHPSHGGRGQRLPKFIIPILLLSANSFATNLFTAGGADAIRSGAKLFQQNCASCMTGK
jgi:hypothetical protein